MYNDNKMYPVSILALWGDVADHTLVGSPEKISFVFHQGDGASMSPPYLTSARSGSPQSRPDVVVMAYKARSLG